MYYIDAKRNNRLEGEARWSISYYSNNSDKKYVI